MKNKILPIIILTGIFACEVHAQFLVLRLEPAFGSFVMKDLKRFQEASIPDIGVNVESISKFPPYFGFGATLMVFRNANFGAGVTADYFSTGARNYYADYSGSYRLDIIANSYDIGAVANMKSGQRGPISSWFEIAGGYKHSWMKLTEELILTNPVASDGYDLASGSVWVRPGFRFDYILSDSFSAGAFLGGELNFKSKIHLAGNNKAYLMMKDGNNITIDWTGVRLGLHLAASF